MNKSVALFIASIEYIVKKNQEKEEKIQKLE